MKKEDYELVFKIIKIGTRAVKNAQEENRKHGLPSVYSKNKKMYYELPDGTITTEEPIELVSRTSSTQKQSNPRGRKKKK